MKKKEEDAKQSIQCVYKNRTYASVFYVCDDGPTHTTNGNHKKAIAKEQKKMTKHLQIYGYFKGMNEIRQHVRTRLDMEWDSSSSSTTPNALAVQCVLSMLAHRFKVFCPPNIIDGAPALRLV